VPTGIAALAAGALIATTISLVRDGEVAVAHTPTPTAAQSQDAAGDARSGARSEAVEPATTDAVPPAVPWPEPDGAATPIDAVRGFIDGLDAGDAEDACRLMHPRYRDAFDSYADFAGELAPAARYGPFAALGGADYQSAMFEEAAVGEAVAVVSVYGRINRDGVPVTETFSMVARESPSGWLVEAGGEGGSEFQEPAEPGEQVVLGEDLVVWTPSAGLSAVLAVVDGAPRETVVTELVDPSETAEIRVQEHRPGVQQLVIGVLREDGSVDTVATHFRT